MKQFRAQRGFTLMELMITVAVVGILAAIAYPSFTEQIARSRRTEAQTILLSGQQWMERFYTENYRYDQNSAGTAVTCASTTKDCPFDVRFRRAPADATSDTAATYLITVSAPAGASSGPGMTYTMTATRAGRMAADRCGDMTVDNLGRRSLVDNSYDPAKVGTTKAAAIVYCWK